AGGGGGSTGPVPTLSAGDVKGLGSFTAKGDTAHAASILFGATGQPQSISVTDAAGAVWTLTLPGDALLEPTLITMTPLIAVTAAAGSPAVNSGVSLGPEGTFFLDPPTLSVKEPAGVAAPILFSAGPDGSSMHFGLATAAATVLVGHFSDEAAAPGPLNPALAEADLAAAAAEAKAVIKSANPAPDLGSVPRDDLSKCPPPAPTDPDARAAADEAAANAAGQALASFSQPEYAIAQRVMGDVHNLAVAGVMKDAETPPYLDLIASLVSRVRDRALKAIKYEGAQPDHGRDVLTPLTRILLGLERQLALLGASAGDIPRELPEWWHKVVRDQFKELKAHDYDAFRRGLILIRMYALMGGSGSQTDSDFQQLLQLLRFKVHVDVTLDGSGNGGSTTLQAQVDGTAKFVDKFPLSDQAAQGKYSFGVIQRSGGAPGHLVLPGSWNSLLSVGEPDTCSKQIALGVAPWGAPSEDFTVAGTTVSISANGAGLLGGCVFLAYSPNLAAGKQQYGFDSMVLPLTNKSAMAAHATIPATCTGGGSNFAMTLGFTVEHVV
ncbi:MAG: hypothetical protein ACJ8F7_16480, partial [Gemmataceae bacterium]